VDRMATFFLSNFTCLRISGFDLHGTSKRHDDLNLLPRLTDSLTVAVLLGMDHGPHPKRGPQIKLIETNTWH